jgi:hypothetical protein
MQIPPSQTQGINRMSEEPKKKFSLWKSGLKLAIISYAILMLFTFFKVVFDRSSNLNGSSGNYRYSTSNDQRRISPKFQSLTSPTDVYVSPYRKQNGTQVREHMRSAPDSSGSNNWSSYPNINPYTGERGDRKSY